MRYPKSVVQHTAPVHAIKSEPSVQRDTVSERLETIRPPERFLVKIEEAARLLSVSERTIRNLVADGILESRGHNRLRRITVASLRRYAEQEPSKE